MKLDITKHDNYALLKFNESKLNVLTSAELRAEFMRQNSEDVSSIIADLSETKFVDSSGLGCLLAGHKLCKDAGGVFIICGLNDSVLRLISIAQLNNLLNITATADEAIKQVLARKSEVK